MNGHDRRSRRITEKTKKAALELFKKYGAHKVSMDEIAARADVSKATIYKYFHSKEDLHREVVNLFLDELFADAEKILESDRNFLEKLNLAIGSNMNAFNVADVQTLFNPANTLETEEGIRETFEKRKRDLIYRFFEQGKQEGYIDESLPVELIYLYQEVFQAGFEAKSDSIKITLTSPESLKQLLDLYFFGFIKKKETPISNPLKS